MGVTSYFLISLIDPAEKAAGLYYESSQLFLWTQVFLKKIIHPFHL